MKSYQDVFSNLRSQGRAALIPFFVIGDPDFDARFAVWQDGVPVREGWLDAPTRAAVTAFFDGPGVAGPVWAQEGRLTYVAVPPARLDEPKLTAILRRQAALASALERTAGWRGPAA